MDLPPSEGGCDARPVPVRPACPGTEEFFWPYEGILMNWDWDKLQEKRQRQNWGNNNNNSKNNEEEPPFGSGSGNGGRGPD